MRPTSSGAIGSEPARPTTNRLASLGRATSTISRVTAAMCGVMTPGQPPDSTKMTRWATSATGMPRSFAVHSRSATSAHTRPQSSCCPVPSVLPTSATSVSGLIFPLSASFCRPDVSAGVPIVQTNMSTRCAFTRLILHPWRSLEAEARHGLELLGEVEERVLLAKLPDQLHADPQPVVQPGRHRHRRHLGEADRQHELHVAPPFVAEKWRHTLDGHGQHAERRRD